MADIFVLHTHVLFEKGGFQSRFLYKDKWITKPVCQGIESIQTKDYVDKESDKSKEYFTAMGGSLLAVNRLWIHAIKETLNIETVVTEPRPALNDLGLPPSSYKDKTKHLIDLIKQNKGNVYVTNPEAKDKYLDEDVMLEAGIEIEYCVVPKNLRKSTFEIFEEFGIEGAMKQLPRRKVEELSCIR